MGNQELLKNLQKLCLMMQLTTYLNSPTSCLLCGAGRDVCLQCMPTLCRREGGLLPDYHKPVCSSEWLLHRMSIRGKKKKKRSKTETKNKNKKKTSLIFSRVGAGYILSKATQNYSPTHPNECTIGLFYQC